MTWPADLQPAAPQRPRGSPRVWQYEPSSLRFKYRSFWYQLSPERLVLTCFCASFFGAVIGIVVVLAVMS